MPDFGSQFTGGKDSRLAEIAARDVPHARNDPAWSGPPPSIPDYGTLFAEPGACGSTVFYFDRNRRRFACNYGREDPYGAEIILHGRRWTVKRLAEVA